MIEIRYKVVNKYLKEIRDIEIRTADVKGMGDVVEILHCKYNDYLNTNLPFFRDSFNVSLHSGHLANLIKLGAIKQVYFDTDTNTEVSKDAYIKEISNNTNTDSNNDISLKDFLRANDVSMDDFKTLLNMAKQMKGCEYPVDKSVDNSNKENEKIIEKSNENEKQKVIVDNFENKKAEFIKMKYQEQLNYIKEKCDDLKFLEWIKGNIFKGAIPNTVSKKIKSLGINNDSK